MSAFRENIVPVVIWYNPKCTVEKENAINNIKSYSYYFKNVIVVDNSLNDNSNFASQIENSIYIPNFDNVGIAKAQNIGIEKAKTLGFKWVLTMDQDSFWDKENLEKYIETAERYLDKNIYCFGPHIVEKKITSITEDIKKSLKSLILKKQIQSMEKTVENLQECVISPWLISSGNLIKIYNWEIVGKFNEDYFIDNVDFEFCLKLTKKFPNSIAMLQQTQLNHCIGDVKKSFFKRIDFHFGTRIYYCVRNSYYLADEFPEMRILILRYKQVFKENIRDLKFREIYLMLRGRKDYRKGIKGKYKN